MPLNRIAIVTGANRGIGFEICRQLAQRSVSAVLTARNKKNGNEAVDKLKKEGISVSFHQLDVTDEVSVKRFGKYARNKLKHVDILINNAAIFPEKSGGPLSSDVNVVRNILETNLIGAWRLSQEIIPLMKKHKYGRIVNISSGSGQFSSGLHPDHPGYATSKASLNAFTYMLADELRGTNILVNAVCPGWVHTRMGGPDAPRSIKKGAETPVWLALLSKGPSGKSFRDKKRIAW